MIEINLLPEELRKKKRRQDTGADASKIRLQDISILKISAIAVGGILSIQMILFAVGVVSGMSANMLGKSYKEMLPKKRETEKLSKQVNSMGKKVVAIDELMVKRFSWTKKLNDLSDSMTPGIWLTQLDYDEKIGEALRVVNISPLNKKGAVENKPVMEKTILRYLTISGMASGKGEEGTALVGRFIKSLKSNSEFYSDFSEIELGTIKREKLDDQEAMEFKITCLFKVR